MYLGFMRISLARSIVSLPNKRAFSFLGRMEPLDGCLTTEETQKIQKALWRKPQEEGKYITGLCVHNSMTTTLTPFIPQEGRTVRWYGCGPTVYDAPHMGHARTYVTFDILQRIMSDYFRYDLQIVMNVTDIDDKIIKKSMEQNISFTELALHWETEFWKDMEALNVRTPSLITRVSEYVEEIIELTKRIISNGFAYESEGSVYFDTEAFSSNERHTYGRLEPYSVKQTQRVLEGEGELGYTSTEKRNPCDFALWKRSKEFEPFWESPWGKGRPGWHIECSAMACKSLAFPLDVHSGGVDLRFPHHDNELAQSEAAYDSPQWVNYFLHSGHLNIEGSKMSKSLKNFITIKEILKTFSAKHIRFLCLFNRWDAPMNYRPHGETMNEAVEIDGFFRTFFSTINSLLLHYDFKSSQKWNEAEIQLNTLLHQTKAKVHTYLCDNFNTPGALMSLKQLTSETNSYINNTKGAIIKTPLIREIAEYIHSMLKVFGVISSHEIFLAYDEDIAGDYNSSVVNCLASFRQEVRNFALDGLKGGNLESDQEKKHMKYLLTLCDELRDTKLIDAGIQLDDRADGTFVIRHVSVEEAKLEKQRKDDSTKEIMAKKALRNQELEKEALEKERRDSVPPSEYCKTFYKDVYSEFDENGIPLKLKSGEALSKSNKKALLKAIEKHTKNYNKWLERQKGGGE